MVKFLNFHQKRKSHFLPIRAAKIANYNERILRKMQKTTFLGQIAKFRPNLVNFDQKGPFFNFPKNGKTSFFPTPGTRLRRKNEQILMNGCKKNEKTSVFGHWIVLGILGSFGQNWQNWIFQQSV